jgi:hypothetical protein
LDGGATVNLVYTNVGNRGKRRTAGTIWPNGDGTFRVRQILLYEDDVAEPFAVSGPMD